MKIKQRKGLRVKIFGAFVNSLLVTADTIVININKILKKYRYYEFISFKRKLYRDVRDV